MEQKIKPGEARLIARERLSRSRYRHSVLVARAAARLAKKYGEDKTAALVAGYLHDIAKELPLLELKRLAAHPDINGFVDEDYARPVLHAFAGARLASELGVTDERIIDAIRYHTTGKPEMSRFSRIIFVADFISADRNYPEARQVRSIARRSLDRAYCAELSIMKQHLTQKGKQIVPLTLAAIDQIERKQEI